MVFDLNSLTFGTHYNHVKELVNAAQKVACSSSILRLLPSGNYRGYLVAGIRSLTCPSIIAIFPDQNWILQVNITFLAIPFILSDPCVRLNCSQYFGACVLSIYSDPECKCLQDCGYQDNPVCGDDKNTYFSECALMKDTCVREIPNRVRHRGQCGK